MMRVLLVLISVLWVKKHRRQGGMAIMRALVQAWRDFPPKGRFGVGMA